MEKNNLYFYLMMQEYHDLFKVVDELQVGYNFCELLFIGFHFAMIIDFNIFYSSILTFFGLPLFLFRYSVS